MKFNDFSGIWCIVNALLCDEIACHTPNYSTRHVENTDHRISSDGGFDDELPNQPNLLKWNVQNA